VCVCVCVCMLCFYYVFMCLRESAWVCVCLCVCLWACCKISTSHKMHTKVAHKCPFYLSNNKSECMIISYLYYQHVQNLNPHYTERIDFFPALPRWRLISSFHVAKNNYQPNSPSRLAVGRFLPNIGCHAGPDAKFLLIEKWFKRQKKFREYIHGGAKQVAIITVSDSIAYPCISFILWHPMSNGLRSRYSDIGHMRCVPFG
jgi:hypothetical protein